VNSLAGGNFLVGVLVGGSMQQLWGMIRAMQYIILCFLIRVPTPGHTHGFFEGCASFAQMDILDGKTLYEHLFRFKETAPLNANYETMDIPDKNFVNNSGSFFPLIAIIVLYNFSEALLNKVATVFARFKCCRRIGMYAYAESWRADVSNEVSKLFLESYFDIAMCACLGLLALTEKDEDGQF
jgi:hypothetical protein